MTTVKGGSASRRLPTALTVACVASRPRVVSMMSPITKYTHQLASSDNIPSRVREAFRLAQEEKTESKRQKTLQRELEWVRSRLKTEIFNLALGVSLSEATEAINQAVTGLGVPVTLRFRVVG